MNRIITGGLGIALSLGVGIAGALAQVGTQAPGMPTPNNVWVQNHGGREAVPVSIEDVAPNAPPLHVQLVGAGGPPQVTAARQVWEYEGLKLTPGQDPIGVLNAAGAEGWESTGAMVQVQGGLVMLMKRPH